MKNYKYLLKEYATIKKLSLLTKLYDSLPDPDKILAENNYDYEILREIMNDPHLIATIQQRKMQVAQMGWEISNTGNEKLKIEIMDFIKKLDLQKIISDVLDAILYGFAVLEISWKVNKDNKIIPINLIEKPQEWFIFSNDSELRLRKNINGNYIFEKCEKLPDYKFILIQNNPSYTNPYGEKILSRCYWPVTLKRATLEYWQLIMERFGIPYIVGRYKVGATDTEQQELLNDIKNMSEDLITVLEENQNVEIIENPKYEIGQLYDKLIDFHNKEISKAVLTVTLTTEVGRIGSYKAAEIHKEMLGYLGITDKKLVEKALNTIIGYYGILNYGTSDMPTIKLTKKEAIIEESAQRDKILESMGIRFTRDYFMKRYNLSEGDFKLSENSKL